jgi:hypothetical protein
VNGVILERLRHKTGDMGWDVERLPLAAIVTVEASLLEAPHGLQSEINPKGGVVQ